MSKKRTGIQEVEDFLTANYEIRQNEVNYQLEYRPFGSKEPFKELNENDIFCELDKKQKGISMSTLLAILKSSYVPKYNPFQEYFDSIEYHYQHDEGIDYIEKLSSHIIVENQERLDRQFKKMMVRSIACSLDDTVFNKHAFILVHKNQNSGKSSFCRWLCPPKLKLYYTENISMDKDGQIALTENFIINLDELSSLSKFEMNTFKSVFSKDFVKVRPPYSAKSIRSPRRANFVGSTNQFNFLNDESGSVRWLCFEITRINWNYKKDIDIDLVWSQAYWLYNNEFEYELNSDEIYENEISNERFQYVSPEQDIVLDTLIPGTKEDHDIFMSATEIISFLAEYTSFHHNLKPITLGKALTKLGFEKMQFNSKHGYYVKYEDKIIERLRKKL